MRKSFNRILSFALSILLCIGMLPSVAFATGVTIWPKLENVALNGTATLTAANAAYNRTVTKVELKNYAAPEDGGTDLQGYSNKVVGEILLYVSEELNSGFNYTLAANSLTGTATIPDGYEEDSGLTAPHTFSSGTTERYSTPIALGVSDDDDANYLYTLKVVVEKTKSWPKLENVALNGTVTLTAANAAYNRAVTKVELKNYDVPEDGGVSQGYSNKVVGEILLYVSEELDPGFNYTLAANSLTGTATIPDGYAADNGLTSPHTFSSGKTERYSTPIAYGDSDDDDANYVYKLKVVVEKAKSWPKLENVALNGTVTLTAANAAYNRAVTKVELKNYDVPEDGGVSQGYSNKVVGEILLYVSEELDPGFNYTLAANSLTGTATIPDGYEADNGLTSPHTFSSGTTERYSTPIAYGDSDDDDANYLYTLKVVVENAEKEFDYPVLKSLSIKSGAALIGLSDKSTISITGATFENYDSARDIQEGGYPAKVAGKVTIYISKAPANQKYQLSAEDFDAVYTSKEGFELNPLLQGSFPAGSISSLSAYYAYNESQDCEYFYDLELQVGYPDDGVYVLDGTGTRIAPTKARVSFNANQAGAYHYAVVDAAATDTPTMPDTGAAMTTGENTFVIDNLTEGAKKVYIWGKNGEKVSARPLVVEIGAEAKSYSLTFDTTTATTDGILRITADGTDVSFKTKIMVTPTTEAKGIYEGQLVTVWMGNPYTDKELNSVTLNPAVDVTIAQDKNSFSFTMPAADVYGTSNDWRTYVDSTETRYTLTGVSSTFDQINVSGIEMGHVVFKDASGNIITQATRGTKVTATPVPSTTANYTLEFQFAGWSDAVGFTLEDADKKNESLIFTVGSENVSIKANFEPVGTKVTWGTNITSPDTNAPQIFMPGYMSSPYVFKQNQQMSAGINGTAWYDRYEFVGWTITRDGVTLTGDAVDTSQAVGTPGTPGYWTWAKFGISGTEMTVTANFRERSFASVTADVNDDAMGSATVAVGTGEAAARQSVVYEGQTVTLTATPGERYSLNSWEVKEDGEDGQVIAVTTDAENSNKATFTMPDTGKDITAKAIFEVDPAKASKECNITDVRLYNDSTDAAPINQGFDKDGTKLTITLPANMDTTNLADLILKFAISDYATIKQKGADENWPADGKACGMTLDTPVTFTVTAEDGKTTQDYTLTITKAKSSEKEITAVKLLNSDKSTLAAGVLSGTTWTITLPSDTDKALIDKIGTSTDVFMQIDYTGVSLAQAEGYDDATGIIGKWSSGNVMCGVSPNSSKTFTVTAEDGSTKTYTVEIKYTAPDAPTLTSGSATRTSKTGATVKFTSNEAGTYFYKVVEHGAAAPTVDTSKNGTAAVEGENTITLSNLTEDARDIYIVVKNASGGESAALKVEIPAYGSSETPDTGKFTITINAPTKGGTLTTNRTKADKGDEIIVTVTPDSGYQMVEGSLTYSLAVAGGETVKITGNRFTMPSGNVTITCKWETASVVSSGITGFSINGVAGTVNNTTNTITITMPRGTDVTKLTPAISTNGVKSLTPGSGETVNFTNSVTYTATMDDGSTRTYIVTVYVDKGTLADQFWDKLTDFYQQVPWWKYAEQQQSSSKYPKYW